MFPFGDEDEEDAEFVEVPAEQPSVAQPTPTAWQAPQQAGQQAIPQLRITDSSLDPAQAQLALYERRGRAIALFVEVPLLTLVAFHGQVPGAIRAGAGLLAVWKAVQLARGSSLAAQHEVQDWVGQ